MKYYADRENGNDSRDGQAPDRAWRTFANINGGSFNPADERLLKRGSIWGEELIEPSSGEKCAPIVLDAYSCGPDPVIDGEGVRDGIKIRHRSHIAARNIKVIGGKDNGVNIYSQDDEGVLLEDVELEGNKNGVWFNIPDVTIRRVHAHHNGTTPYHHGIYPSEYQQSASLDFLIEDCDLHHNAGGGVAVKGGSGKLLQNHIYANGGIDGGSGVSINMAAAGGIIEAERNFLHDNFSGFYMISNDDALRIELRNNVVFGEIMEPAYTGPMEYQNLIYQRDAVAPYLLENNLYYRKTGGMIWWDGVDYTQAQFQDFKDASGQESLGLSDDFPLLWFAIRAGHLWQ